jgi:hypothetical protein
MGPLFIVYKINLIFIRLPVLWHRFIAQIKNSNRIAVTRIAFEVKLLIGENGVALWNIIYTGDI